MRYILPVRHSPSCRIKGSGTVPSQHREETGPNLILLGVTETEGSWIFQEPLPTQLSKTMTYLTLILLPLQPNKQFPKIQLLFPHGPDTLYRISEFPISTSTVYLYLKLFKLIEELYFWSSLGLVLERISP